MTAQLSVFAPLVEGTVPVSLQFNLPTTRTDLVFDNQSGGEFVLDDDQSAFVTVIGSPFSTIDVFTGSGDDVIVSNSQGYIGAGAGNNFLFLSAGNTIDTGDGNNTIFLVEGFNDILTGAGSDVVIGAGGGSSNIVNTGDGDDVVSLGLGDDCIEGGNGNDILLPGSGLNQVFGGAGDDIIGATGDDNSRFVGGEGADQFIINAALFGATDNPFFYQSDFTIGVDTLSLGFSAVAGDEGFIDIQNISGNVVGTFAIIQDSSVLTA